MQAMLVYWRVYAKNPWALKPMGFARLMMFCFPKNIPKLTFKKAEHTHTHTPPNWSIRLPGIVSECITPHEKNNNIKKAMNGRGFPPPTPGTPGTLLKPWAKWTTVSIPAGSPSNAATNSPTSPPSRRPETMASYWGKWDSPWWPRNEKKHLSS